MLVGTGIPYEHVLAKARGLYSYKSNNLDPEKDKIEQHRTQRRVNCGWASSIHKPYRPLGTPDTIDKRKFNLLQQSFARYERKRDGDGSNSKKGKKMVLNTLNGGDESEMYPLGEEEHATSFDLKTEIRNSNIRRIGCRSGASFKDVLFKQSPTKSPGSPFSPSKSGENALPKIVSRINEDERKQSASAASSPSKTPSRSPIISLPTVPSPSPTKKEKLAAVIGLGLGDGKAKKTMTEQDFNRSPSKLPNVSLEIKKNLSAELLTLDPSTSMSHRLDEFRKVKKSMNTNLATKLKALSEERFETYKRKLQSFKTDYHTFSTERWKLEAERVKIEARLNALNMHKWYFSFIQFFDSMTRHSPAEKVIISQVKYVIEGGYEYNQHDLQRLIALLPKRAYKMTSVLQILNNLRNELEIGDEDYMKYLRSCDITVPSWSISKGKRGIARGARGANRV